MVSPAEVSEGSWSYRILDDNDVEHPFPASDGMLPEEFRLFYMNDPEFMHGYSGADDYTIFASKDGEDRLELDQETGQWKDVEYITDQEIDEAVANCLDDL